MNKVNILLCLLVTLVSRVAFATDPAPVTVSMKADPIGGRHQQLGQPIPIQLTFENATDSHLLLPVDDLRKRISVSLIRGDCVYRAEGGPLPNHGQIASPPIPLEPGSSYSMRLFPLNDMGLLNRWLVQTPEAGEFLLRVDFDTSLDPKTDLEVKGWSTIRASLQSETPIELTEPRTDVTSQHLRQLAEILSTDPLAPSDSILYFQLVREPETCPALLRAVRKPEMRNPWVVSALVFQLCQGSQQALRHAIGSAGEPDEAWYSFLEQSLEELDGRLTGSCWR